MELLESEVKSLYKSWKRSDIQVGHIYSIILHRLRSRQTLDDTSGTRFKTFAYSEHSSSNDW
jgi:hypothetical protein